jgi:DMSO/TMAO reductase YedYZ molybdopterin-dependent catalytic subunit
LADWELVVEGAVATPRRWKWEEFRALPREPVTVDIHCVTKWSKLDTAWEGVSLDVILDGVSPQGDYLTAESYGEYTSNVPLGEVTGGQAWIVDTYDAKPLPIEHGGPARLLVPHLYFWKSAKWIRRLRITTSDAPGFWESLGYHNHGDPWKEERYWGD